MDADRDVSPEKHTVGQPVEFSQLALWMAANLAGMVTAVLLIRGPFYRALARRVGRGKIRPAGSKVRKRSLSMLAAAIVGSDKATIEAVFGPPRSTAIEELSAVVVHPQKIFWEADLWYYPLKCAGPTAMAIRFQDQCAARVEFFTAPEGREKRR